ncbi:MAG: hypothetical protein Q9220_007236 [cf. Caloplaca sp. 1 TL-2023]
MDMTTDTVDPNSAIVNTDSTTSLPVVSQSTILKLQVGEERFTTLASTVKPSGYFGPIISGRWTPQHDGSYFIDADPRIFKHILHYLRHGVYPLCYSRSDGGYHDYTTYLAIRQLADYLGISALVSWFDERMWMSGVKKSYSTEIMETLGSHPGYRSIDSDEVVRHYPLWKEGKRYLCPGGIRLHYDKPWMCVKACGAARESRQINYEDYANLTILVVKERLRFSRPYCTGERRRWADLSDSE